MGQRDNYFSSHAVAKLIEVSPSAVLNWIEKGILVAYRTPGGHRRIERGALIRFLHEHDMPIPPALAGVARLLVIDDDTSFLRTAKRLLKRTVPSLTIQTAEGGVDGLIQMGLFRPDAVLLDAYMPGVDGIEVCRALRKTKETKHVMVIALTGRPSRQLEDKFLSAGAVAVVNKPLDARHLLDLLGFEKAA